MNTITILVNLEGYGDFIALFERGGQSWVPLYARNVDEAVAQAIRKVCLRQDFRDPLGEEWDILIPDETRAFEFPEPELNTRRRAWNTRWEKLEDGLDSSCGPPPPFVTLPGILPVRVRLSGSGLRTMA